MCAWARSGIASQVRTSFQGTVSTLLSSIKAPRLTYLLADPLGLAPWVLLMLRDQQYSKCHQGYADICLQLPQYFPASSRDILPNFNAYNREEMSRYIPLKNCHFVIDYDPQGQIPEEFSHGDWKVVSSYPFLEQSRSPNPLFRCAAPLLCVSSSDNAYSMSLIKHEVSTWAL